MTQNTFTQFNLHPKLMQMITEIGYTEPTAIQSAVIPAMLAGQDVIGQAQTGTGKTAAFSFPILHNLTVAKGCVQSLVVAPTRELAVQVAEAMSQYGKFMNVQVLAVYGGQSYIRQTSRLKKGVDIVVGTPGRLLDLIRQKALDLTSVSSVVLDEADEMLSMGFIEDIESILAMTPAVRQTALFSATLPQRIRMVADRYMRTPQSFTIDRAQIAAQAVEQRYYLINEFDRLAAVSRLLDSESVSSAIVFARTRLETSELANSLVERGFLAEALNGDMSQDARERTLKRFRRNQIQVLAATDVAARGLDIDDISHVFNLGLPKDPEIYVHRIGRTGRAGKKGIAISILAPADRRQLARVEAYTRQKINASILPAATDIMVQRETRFLKKILDAMNQGTLRKEQKLVADLIKGGHDILNIAAAALKLTRDTEMYRPIEPISSLVEPRQQKKRLMDQSERRRKQHEPGFGTHEKQKSWAPISRRKSNGSRFNRTASHSSF
ncbi:MAG: DEAD/DEAH box helicase [Desulfatirhabdiaceae bacterium]